MQCPRCAQGQTIEAVVYGEIELDRCPQCQGLWLDAGEMTALKEWFTAEDAFITDAAAHPELERDASAAQSPCPQDQTPLKGCVLPKTEGFDSPILDICPACHGIWVDGGERAALHAILMQRHRDGLDTVVELRVPAPVWQRALRWVVPSPLYTKWFSRG